MDASNVLIGGSQAALRASACAPPYDVYITNMVITARFNLTRERINLKDLAIEHQWLYYKPAEFAAAHARFVNPRATFLLFPGGIGVVTGARSLAQALTASRAYCLLLRNAGLIEAEVMCDYVVQNIVSACDCGFRVNLVQVERFMGKDRCTVNYNSDQFPAAIFRRAFPDGLTIVWLIFDSGKIIMTAGKREEDRYPHMAWLHSNVLVHCREVDASAEAAAASAAKNHADRRRDAAFRMLNTTGANLSTVIAADAEIALPDEMDDIADRFDGGEDAWKCLINDNGDVYDDVTIANNLGKLLEGTVY